MKHYDGLVASELTELIGIARRRYAELAEVERQRNRCWIWNRPATTEASIDDNASIDGDSRSSDVYGRWCRTIQTTEDESTLAELSASIEGDQQLSPAERNALQKLLQSNRDEAAMTASVGN